METVELKVETLGDKFQDYRDAVYGNSFTFGPLINSRNVQFLTFHHSVTPAVVGKDIKKTVNGKTIIVKGEWKDEVDYIARIHVDNNNWAGIGYHFVICSDGTVAYVADLSHGAANVEMHNDINFGACMVGDFTKHLPTDEQIRSAHLLAEWLLERSPQWPNLNDWDRSIRGHKDWADPVAGINQTACPGSSWPNDMKYRIKYGLVYTPPKVVEPEKPLPSSTPDVQNGSNVVIPNTTVEIPQTTISSVPPSGGSGGSSSDPQPTLVVEPQKTTVQEIPVIDMSKPQVVKPQPVQAEMVGNMRHVDYVIAVFRYIIKIFKTPIKLW